MQLSFVWKVSLPAVPSAQPVSQMSTCLAMLAPRCSPSPIQQLEIPATQKKTRSHQNKELRTGIKIKLKSTCWLRAYPVKRRGCLVLQSIWSCVSSYDVVSQGVGRRRPEAQSHWQVPRSLQDLGRDWSCHVRLDDR